MSFWVKSLFIFFIFLLIFVLGAFCFILDHHTIDFSSLQQDTQAKPSVLLDIHGNIWGTFQFDKREFVLLERMPEHLISAFLVTEDRDFFKHPGISFRGILRSFVVNICAHKKIQGASTITQQLVRLLFLNNKKTISRKIKEQLYAIVMERQWSKEQILEAYLNNVYFGHGIYGVQAACQRFWGKNVADITVDQAAILASIMKSPQAYSPVYHPDNLHRRRNMILKMMSDAHMISADQLDLYMKQSVQVQELDASVIAPHLKETIRIGLEARLGRYELYTKGFIIQTTLDVTLQVQAEKSFKEHVHFLQSTLHDQVDGAMVVLDRSTGQVRCMIGGYDFTKSQVNRAIQSKKQMGSIFKIFVYAQALLQGLKLSDVLIDEPFEMIHNGVLWAPKNYNNIFLGAMTRAYALSHSNNIVAIKTLLQTGIDSIIRLAKACHLDTDIKPYPSLALGCLDVTALQAVGAFNIIVNNGMYVKPHWLLWVKNSVGDVVVDCAVPEAELVIDSIVADQIAHVLTFSIKRLTSLFKRESLSVPALGKSGTTNDSRICWFCGATPELTTAIYIGCDYNQSLGKNVFGSKTGFPIWFNFHAAIENTVDTFYKHPSLKPYAINWRTGQINESQSNAEVVTLLQPT